MSASEQRTDDSSSQDIHSTKDQSCSSKNLLSKAWSAINGHDQRMKDFDEAVGAYRALRSIRDSFESIYDNIDDPAGRIAVREHLYRHFIIILNDKIREQFSKI